MAVSTSYPADRRTSLSLPAQTLRLPRSRIVSASAGFLAARNCSFALFRPLRRLCVHGSLLSTSALAPHSAPIFAPIRIFSLSRWAATVSATGLAAEAERNAVLKGGGPFGQGVQISLLFISGIACGTETDSACLRSPSNDRLLRAGQHRLIRIEHDLVRPGGSRQMKRSLFAVGEYSSQQHRLFPATIAYTGNRRHQIFAARLSARWSRSRPTPAPFAVNFTDLSSSFGSAVPLIHPSRNQSSELLPS